MAKRKVAKGKTVRKTTKKKTAKKSTKSPARKTASRTLPEPEIPVTMKKKTCCTNWAVYLLRVLLGLMFLFTGILKFLALIGSTNPLETMGIPLFLTWVVALVEILGGIFLILNVLKVESVVLLGIIMIVALILLLASPMTWKNWVEGIMNVLVPHLFYIAALLAVLFERKTC